MISALKAMLNRSPEAVVRAILTRTQGVPSYHPKSEATRKNIQKWFGGKLAQDFDYGDLFLLEHANSQAADRQGVKLQPAVVVGNDAYFYWDGMLIALIREVDGEWRLRIALSMCWGCFGDHSFSWGQCWSVTCKCCGGTGWESGDLEFCVVRPLTVDPGVLLPADNTASETFRHLLAVGFRPLERILGIETDQISPCIVRGDTAKIEVRGADSRYLVMLNKTPEQQWFLSTILPLCTVCAGRGTKSPDEFNNPCPACAGLKWGHAGDLRYCRNYAEPYWYWEEKWPHP